MSKKRRTASVSPSRKILQVKTDLLRPKTSYHAASKLKTETPIDQLKTLIPQYLSQTRFVVPLCGKLFPQSTEELKATVPFREGGIERELLWEALIISHWTERIRPFHSLRDQFSRAIAIGAYDEAGELLRYVHTRYGESLWLIENKINLYALSEGLEVQKAYAKQVSTNARNEALVRYFTSFYSDRAEKNLSAARYVASVNSLDANLRRDHRPQLAAYISYKLASAGSTGFTDPGSILRFESSSALLDRYDTFIKVCRFICADPAADVEIEAVRGALSVVHTSLDDPEMMRLRLVCGLDDPIISPADQSQFIQALDLYTRGKYQESALLATEIVQSCPERIDAYELLAKSSIRSAQPSFYTKPNSIQQRLVSNIPDVLTKSRPSHDAFAELRKIALQFSSLSWAAALNGLLVRYYQTVDKPHFLWVSKSGGMCAAIDNPHWGGLFLMESTRESYFSSLHHRHPESPTIGLMKAVELMDEVLLDSFSLVIPSGRCTRYRARIYERNGRYVDAIAQYAMLMDSQDALERQAAILGQINACYQAGQLHKCLELMAGSYTAGEYYFVQFPIVEILDAISVSNDRTLRARIELPIIYDLYSRHVSKERDLARNEAYEDYLDSLAISFPSEIEAYINDVNIRLVVHFLRHICIPSVMDTSINFTSSNEVEYERLKICQLLRKHDVDNDALYSEEIKEIAQRRVLSTAIREVEQSKVHVDVDGIRMAMDSSIRESFERYQAIASSCPPGTGEVFITLGVDEANGYELSMPGDEVLNLLTVMYLEIRDKFISSNEYGLDGYLSVRIRHGTLVGQLRLPLEVPGLVCQRDNQKNEYQDNVRWMAVYVTAPDEIRSEINKSLKKFSREVDGLVSMLKDRWIQISTELKNPDGLFKYTFSVDMLRILQSMVANVTTHEVFFDTVIKFLWAQTEVNLEKVRTKITDSLIENFNQVFDKLQHDILAVHRRYLLTDLMDQISNARTAIQNELTLIASWFTRPKESSFADYEPILPINIGIEMLRNIYPARSLDPTVRVSVKSKFAGHTLRSLVDIMFILLDNVVKHSGLSELTPETEVSLQMDNDGLVELLVTNPIAKDQIDSHSKQVEEINARLQQGDVLKQISREGGTGLAKIAKILLVDLKGRHGLYIGIKNGQFVVSITLRAEGVFP